MDTNIDDFTLAYIEAALWSTLDDDGGTLDENFTMWDFSSETLSEVIKDYSTFQKENQRLLEEAKEVDTSYDETHMGYDFWFTRNHHGAGFWDRGLREVGDALTKASHAYGEVDLYVGDDGLIYVH